MSRFQFPINISFVLLQPFFALMRLEKPTGIWLLMLPCWWGIALAAESLPNIELLLIFSLGSIIMRGAGCTINDIVDRNIDNKVARTKDRPIASGKISLTQSLIFLAILLLIGLFILLSLNKLTIIIGLASMIYVIAYPFMKRYTYWPQAFLGLTFNMGAIMGFTAVAGKISLHIVYLYLIGIFWTLIYDTIYAHQDKDDDKLIGVKSTALKFAENTKLMLVIFAAIQSLLIIILGMSANLNIIYFIVNFINFYLLFWQINSLNINDAQDCMHKFKFSPLFGLLLFFAIILGKI